MVCLIVGLVLYTQHGRMESGGHRPPKVLPGPAMPNPSTPCGLVTPETALWPFREHTGNLSQNSFRLAPLSSETTSFAWRIRQCFGNGPPARQAAVFYPFGHPMHITLRGATTCMNL
jgi:hypothetical protein